MNNFTYHNPTKIIFGKGQIDSLKAELKPYANETILFVYGRRAIQELSIDKKVYEVCQALNITCIDHGGVKPNPSLESVLEGRRKILQHDVTFILAAGGGSVIDAAKAMAFAPYMSETGVWDVFLRKAHPEKALPLGVILTLAATGTEMNGNTVITNEQTRQKRSCGYPVLHPKFSIIDPVYTQSVPAHFVTAGCIDITMHIFEQFFSNTLETDTADAMSLGLLKNVIALTDRLRRGEDTYDVRANLSWASTLALNWLLAQGKVGDWATHQLSYPVTEQYGLTHGYALTTLYPAWLKTALKYNPDTMIRRLGQIGAELFDVHDPAAVIERIRALYRLWGAPTTFKEAGFNPDEAMLKKFVEKVTIAGSVGTVIEVDETIALEIYQASLT